VDVVPIVALIGKLVHSLTGATVNLYGGYLFLCFALPRVMTTLVLVAAKIRHGLAAVIAASFLWRWGHIALEAHDAGGARNWRGDSGAGDDLSHPRRSARRWEPGRPSPVGKDSFR
jgi:hypothetical protein